MKERHPKWQPVEPGAMNREGFEGHWVKRGLTWHPVKPPTERVKNEHGGPEPYTHAETAALVLPVLESLQRLTDKGSGTQHGWLCECGCLLIGAETTCFACLVWAQKNANEHSWQLEERNNRVA